MQTNTDHIIRDCCEAEVAEFGKPDTICITVDDLREIVQRHSPGQCLHQIQEPAAAEQAAWHAGLDEGRAQAAPAAVAVPDLQDMLRELRVQIHKITVQLSPSVDCSGVWMAHNKMSAALAATPAAVAPVVLPEPSAAIKEVMGLIADLEREAADVGYGHGSQRLVNEKRAAIESKLRALLAGVSTPAAQVVKPEPHASGQVDNTVIFHFDDAAQAREFYSATQSLQLAVAAPQAQADAREAQLLAFAVSEIRRDEMTDSELLDAMEQKRIAVVPEYEGPWDAEIYNDEGKPNHRGSGSTPREAIRAAIAAAKGE